MLEMLKTRKEELEARGVKGFTLMEMLIVIAIIAVLIAIAIPLFTSQLNSARVATDEANIRSGYAVAMATVMSDNITTGKTWKLNKDGSIGDEGTYTTQGNNSTAVTIGTTTLNSWESGKGVTYTYDPTNNKVNIAIG